ncbi:MAG: STAS domain-containing protein [Planctomycetaceae bacterium]|nr:STAS domain-containing protein [Planctomycetaceae bacterium]
MSASGAPQILREGNVTVVAYGPECDRITEDHIPETLQTLLSAITGSNPCMLFDLSHVKFFGSSFIEVLFRVWNRIQQQPGGRFALCGLTPNCAEVIEVTNLDRLWPTFPTREAALQALQTPGAT